MRQHTAKFALFLLGGVLVLGLLALAWMLGPGASQAQQSAMLNCPQPGKWAIAVWDGDDGTETESALDTCAATTVVAAYYIDPETQSWLRWFAGRPEPEISNLSTLDKLQGVLALGGATTAAAAAEAAEVETLSTAQTDQMLNCPQPGKWSIAIWDGPGDTDTGSALDTCADTAVVAAYYIDPETQGWLRWFAGRPEPEISNLSTLDELQGVLALGSATGQVVTPTPTPGEISFSVDESITPAASELPGFEDGAPRPLASLTDESGTQADFVADELVLLTDDPDALDAFLARWDGEVLLTIDPAEYGLTGISPMYLVRIDTSLADASALEADLRALTEEGQGLHRVSSEQGLELLAAAASEGVEGLGIGVNWVAAPDDFRHHSTQEAPTGPGPAYSRDAYDWDWLRAGSVQDIGVTEAWTALDLAGRLDNKVDIAILDMGFEPNDDFPAGWVASSNVPFADAIGTESWADGWHGTSVVGAGMAVPDNRYGAAGPAGPVADLIMVFTLYDFFTGSNALAQAALLGADIINMSYSIRVPVVLSFSVLPFEFYTWWFRNTADILIFASAGNDGDNVDARDCVPIIDWPCWEEAWRTPCENAGVICVGGLGWNSKGRATPSNYGERRGDTVDIFAPYTVWVGPNPGHPGNIAQTFGGTSAASPYAAGVAALIWAADPSLSADEVQDILYDTAHTAPAPVYRYVNAYEAVMEALGPMPPEISITYPPDGSSHSRGATINFMAEAWDVPDGLLTGNSIVWTSSVDGQIGTGTSILRNDLSFGGHTITATATDSDGLTGSDSIAITIVNDPPTVEITSPSDGDEFYQAQEIILRGISSDPNTLPYPYDPLPDDQVEWRIDGSWFFARGHEATIGGGTLKLDLGSHTISFTGTDGEYTDTDTITSTITINPTPVDPPPHHVEITSPENNAEFEANELDAGGWYVEVTLVGEADDIPDGPLTSDSLVWTASVDGGPPEELGTGESPTVKLYWLAPCGDVSEHDITLTATDSTAQSATDTIRVTVYRLC